MDKFSVLIVSIIASFLTPFMGASINVALPSIGNEFKMDAILLSWVPSSYLLSTAVFLVPFGRIADIYGRKKIFTYGIFIFTIFTFLSATPNSGFLLILFRILQGIGSAMIFSANIAILTSVFPLKERGKVLGINVSSVYIGLSIGPFLGGILTQHFSWRSIFLVCVPLGLIVIFLIFWKLKEEWKGLSGEKFDLIGSFIYSVTVISIMYGLSLLPKIIGFIIILIGILCFLIFIRWEIKEESPVLNINIFKNNKVFTFSSLAAFINYSATFAVGFLLSLYLHNIKGLNPQNTGLILISQPIVMAIFSPIAGKLSDKVEPRIVASIGMIMSAIGLSFFIFLNEQTSLEFIISGLIFLGFGFALFSSPNMNAIMSSVEKKFYGIASAIVSTMRLIGQMFGMGITTLTFALYIGRVEITPEYYPVFLKSIHTSFVIFTILSLFGIYASFVRGKVHT